MAYSDGRKMETQLLEDSNVNDNDISNGWQKDQSRNYVDFIFYFAK